LISGAEQDYTLLVAEQINFGANRLPGKSLPGKSLSGAVRRTPAFGRDSERSQRGQQVLYKSG
jgi:hypothetical protein